MNRTSIDPSLNRSLLKWSWKEIRHGQLWPIMIALTLIIACVFGLAALADRLDQVVDHQGKNALTADTLYQSSNPIYPELLQNIEQQKLENTRLTRFSTMAFSDQSSQLVTVKAVDDRYPLRGEMILKGTRQETSTDQAQLFHHVKEGELWLDIRVMQQLDVNIGDTVSIGDADFVVSGELLQEAGLSFNPFQQMPSVYINQSDMDKTGAIQIGSRVRYQLYVNGDSEQLTNMKQTVALTPSDKWIDQDTGSRTSQVFDRTKQYLSLTVVIVIIMAAITLVLTCQNYVASRRQTIAMLKSLGAQKSWLYRWLAIQISCLFLIGIICGTVIGILLEIVLRIPLTDILPSPLPGYGIGPFLFAIGACLAMGIPALGIPLFGLLNTSAASVMQVSSTKAHKKIWLLLILPIGMLILLYGSNSLVWLVLAAVVILFVLLGAFSIAVTKVLQKMSFSPSLRLAFSRINRSLITSGVQFGALGLSLMLIALIWLVRSDLLNDWQQTLPEDAPNVFALNISESEKTAYLERLDKAELNRSQAYPVIRGRLATINGIEAKEYAPDAGESDPLRRELNFTWDTQLPETNVVLESTWENSDQSESDWGAKGGVSVESHVADDLGLKLNDKLTFVISGQAVEATINSIRKVEWREMKPNFYFIFSPDVLENMPSTWLVSFQAPEFHALLDKSTDEQLSAMIGSSANRESTAKFLNQLARDYPTVSLMDLRVMTSKVQVLLSQIVWSITVLAGLAVVAGLLLIFTLLRLSLSQRQQEIRLYRTLGASRKRISNTVWCEYGIMALVAGLVASLGAEISAASLMKYGFELDPIWHPFLWVVLPVLAFVILAMVLRTLIKQLLIPSTSHF